jgi:GAF domain-containing protein
VTLGCQPPDSATWASVIEKFTLSSLFWTIFAILALAAIFIVVWQGYRSGKDGRQFKAFWGLYEVGQQPTPLSTPSTPPVAPPSGQIVESAACASFRIVRAVQDIIQRRGADRQGYVLSLLHDATNQTSGVSRRASILRIGHMDDGDSYFKLSFGFPDSSFKKPHAEFLKSEFIADRVGLCWAAVHTCKAALAHEDDIRRMVFYTPDVSKEHAYKSINGHSRFKSILIAPILDETGEPLGAVCLDSDRTDHYGEKDQWFVALVAIGLSIAWRLEAAQQNQGSTSFVRVMGGGRHGGEGQAGE